MPLQNQNVMPHALELLTILKQTFAPFLALEDFTGTCALCNYFPNTYLEYEYVLE